MRCFAYCTAGQYNLDAIGVALQKRHPLLSIHSSQDYVHARFLESSATENGLLGQSARPEAFFFKEGSVVLWNTTEQQDQSLLELLAKHAERDPFAEDMQDEEEMKFIEDQSRYSWCCVL